MGWGISDPLVSGTFAAIWSVITTIWSWLTSLYNIIKPVWGIISQIWGAIKSIWDYLKPLVTSIYTNFIKPIKDLLTTLWSKFDALLDWVDKLYMATIGQIERVYDLLFGKIEDLWSRFETFRDKAVRLISKVDKDLAAKIQRETERLEAKTLGQIRDTRDFLTSKVNEYYHAIRDYVNERYQALKDLIDPYIARAIEVERHLKISWDKPGQLSEEAVTVSVAEHPHPFETIIGRAANYHAPDEEYDWLEEMGPQDEIDTYLEWMEAGGEGPWSDVEHSFIDIIERVDKGEPPGDVDIDPGLFTPEESKDLLTQIEFTIINKALPWMPTWNVWLLEKLAYGWYKIAESYEKYCRDYYGERWTGK